MAIAALLDSGATQSYLSLDDAELLGLSDLKLADWSITVLGNSVRAFTTEAKIEACVIVESEDGSPAIWGPWVPIKPVFGRADEQVLGISDFFLGFHVEFASAAGRFSITPQ